MEIFGGLGGVSLMSQVVGTIMGILIAIIGGALVYGGIKAIFGIRLSEEDEAVGSDLAIHRISSVSDKDW